MPGTIGRRLLVSGRVQGVGYRAACARAARALGVAGRVRNLPDGRVEVLAAGAGPVVDELIAWCRHGPRGARVTRVDTEPWVPPADLGSGFAVDH